MGNEFSTAIIRTDIRSKEDRDGACEMFNNAIGHIFRNSYDKAYTILANGNSNILIKTKTNPERYYRICFRAYLPEAVERMRKTVNVIKTRDYGFLVPLESYFTKYYIYHRIQLVDRVKDVTYMEMYEIFKKVMPLSEHGLAWIDYKPSNLGYVDGKIVIIDFDCMDSEDIADNIRWILEKHNLENDPSVVKRWLRSHMVKCNRMHPHYLNLLIGIALGYTDPESFMRMRFNYDLYRKKNGFKYTRFNNDIYEFMMKTPFGLL